MNWIKESNRPKHLLYAIPAGACLPSCLSQDWQLVWNSRINNGVANGTGLILRQR